MKLSRQLYSRAKPYQTSVVMLVMVLAVVIGFKYIFSTHASNDSCTTVPTQSFQKPSLAAAQAVTVAVKHSAQAVFMSNQLRKHSSGPTQVQQAIEFKRLVKAHKALMLEAMWRNPTAAMDGIMSSSDQKNASG